MKPGHREERRGTSAFLPARHPARLARRTLHSSSRASITGSGPRITSSSVERCRSSIIRRRRQVYASYEGTGGVPLRSSFADCSSPGTSETSTCCSSEHLRRQRDPDPALDPDRGSHDRTVPHPRSRSLSGRQRGPDVLDAGRLHDERNSPTRSLRPAKPQLYQKFGEGGDRRLQRHRRVLPDGPGRPIAATYQRIFPALFKPFAVMPPDLQKHIRYPEDLFLIQARFSRPTTWKHRRSYNREDLWRFPPRRGR